MDQNVNEYFVSIKFEPIAQFPYDEAAHSNSGEDVEGGGWGGRFFSEGFDSLPTQTVPLCTILRYPFLVTDPKTFLKAPRRQYILILRGERAPKKRDFLFEIIEKVPKNVFFGVYAAQKVWPK